MAQRWNHLSWGQLLPRIAADLILVQFAAITSLAAVAFWQMNSVPPQQMGNVLFQLRQCYFRTFLPLSLLFPLVFLWAGFYSRSRSYRLQHKWAALARGATFASLLFLFLNFLWTRNSEMPRSASIAFLLLVNAGTIGARLLKHWISRPMQTALRPAVQVAPLEGDRPVLVVGGAGYIGSVLCRKLLERGRRVRLMDNFVYGDRAVRELFGHPRFELQIGDCRNIQNVVSALNGAGSIIHLAAIVGDPACEQDRHAALEINYSATRMMIEIAKGYGVKRFVFASSCSVYGATEAIVDEKSQLNPISLYAQTKLDSERALLQARSEGFHPVILRLATVFGSSYRPRFDLVVNLLTAKAITEGVITIYNGEQWRPFIHVSDVAEGLILALDAPLEVVSGEIYNLGDSRLNHTLLDVAATIQKLVPGTRLEHKENPDRRNYRVSFDKIRQELGFERRITLEEGIRDLIASVHAHRLHNYTEPIYHNQRYLQAAGGLAPGREIDSQVMAAFALALQNQQNPLAPA